MMTIARSMSYHFYNILEVEDSTYDDIRHRLEKEGQLKKQAMTDNDGQEILVFGSTAFKKEQTAF